MKNRYHAKLCEESLVNKIFNFEIINFIVPEVQEIPVILFFISARYLLLIFLWFIDIYIHTLIFLFSVFAYVSESNMWPPVCLRFKSRTCS